ncbi:hypothetical protein DEO72_LG7g1070 [Vigna unguiculata]|uniref:Uncharacterized protein n=1 Tax=Vigna unguiculata TaxID=3917 RepID=A0A4D6MJ77_VIGUN|nr:hypothetical protein DEO72_LG7g1070 [Vigna unguiculata]
MNVVAYSNIFVVLITNKATVSQRSFQKNIDKNPLQQLDIITVNNFSSCSSTLVEQQITSQSATSTLTYHNPFGGRSEVVNDSHSVSKNKVVKYPFEVIQSLQNRFNLDDETTTQHASSDTTNDDSATIRDDEHTTSTTTTNELYCKGELQGT